VRDLLRVHGGPAKRANPHGSRDVRDLRKRRHATVEMLSDDHAIDALLRLGDYQDFLASRNVFKFH
jgi:hypothetical protein